MATAPSTLRGGELPAEMLQRFRTRAASYDTGNTFFDDDFAELRDAGYLKIGIPEELGGAGLNLHQVGAAQRRLAEYAPADAVAVNMHIYWTGLAADLYHLGDNSCRWLLEEAARGEVFAAGHAERGNDITGLLSTTSAAQVDGGYRVNGRKSFGTMTPVWTYLGLHAMDTSDPAAPKIVHGFLHRDAPGVKVVETWDSLGMRATRSDDTILEDAFIPNARIPRVVPAGAAGMDLFVLGIFAWALSGFSNVYYGLARRALQLAIHEVQTKKSIALQSGTYAHHPGYQQGIAEMVILCNAMEQQLDGVTSAYSAAVRNAASWAPEDGPGWATKIVGMKHMVTEQAFRVADLAVEMAGGFGVSRHSEIERLFRDARMGRIHPANSILAHELIAKIALGIDLDGQPRWG